MRASFSSVSPPVTFRRSCQYSSSGYASVRGPSGPLCMVLMLRVWRLLPPRKWTGADSTTSTEAPFARAVIAAQRAALPPPSTSTSRGRAGSRAVIAGSVLIAAQPAVDRIHGARDVVRPRRCEEDREVRELFGLAVAPHGNLVLRLPRPVFGRVVAQDLVGEDAARRNAVHGDAVLSHLAREALRPCGERGLRAEGPVHV